MGWTWEETTPWKSGSSGDLSKLFKNEPVKNPGVLAVNAPSDRATLLAREVIQNSWDAAIELQRTDDNAPQFEIEFEYRDLTGDARRAAMEAMDLQSLAQRVRLLDRSKIGLRQSDCLDRLDEEPLPVMVITEKGTTGMYGPWESAASKMYLALISLGYTAKDEGAGGSYGYGKAGLISGSATRTVFAYTCFRERPDDLGVTRRLLGMTYWGEHDLDGKNYSGFARLGETTTAGVRPFENERADAVAELLGIPTRRSDHPSDLGTTFLLLDPTVEPLDLVTAISRSWWPAVIDNDFIVTVRDASGHIHHPRPRRDPILQAFIRAYEVATFPQDNPQPHERSVRLQAIRAGGREFTKPGSLGLVADPTGWSYADETTTALDEHAVEHHSLVALMRGPKMVVEYYVAGNTPPYVRGAFVAGDSIDDLLRRTEPKGHDAWKTSGVEGELEELGAEIARKVLARIKNQVAEFRRQLKPPKQPPENIQLPYFDEVMRKFIAGTGRGRVAPVADTRPVSIRLDQSLEPTDGLLVRLRGRAHIALSEHFEGDESEVEVSLTYKFLEDGVARTAAELTIDPPDGFVPVGDTNGTFRGRLSREGGAAVFEFRSEPYSSDWTGRLFVTGEPVRPVAEAEPTE